MKILVIEDDMWVARSLQRGLRGHDVTVQLDSAVAVEHVARAELEGAPFDLVISDLTMTPVSGLELITMLRARRAPPMLVVLTGSDDLHDAERVADAVLMKPCTGALILAAVGELEARRSPAPTRPISCPPSSPVIKAAS